MSKYLGTIISGWQVTKVVVNGKTFVVQCVDCGLSNTTSFAAVPKKVLKPCQMPLQNYEDDGSWDLAVEQAEFEHWSDGQIKEYAEKVKREPSLLAKFRSILIKRRTIK
jgi:hypothetical protein